MKITPGKIEIEERQSKGTDVEKEMKKIETEIGQKDVDPVPNPRVINQDKKTSPSLAPPSLLASHSIPFHLLIASIQYLNFQS